MKCPDCNKEIRFNWEYCPHCSGELKHEKIGYNSRNGDANINGILWARS